MTLDSWRTGQTRRLTTRPADDPEIAAVGKGDVVSAQGGLTEQAGVLGATGRRKENRDQGEGGGEVSLSS